MTENGDELIVARSAARVIAAALPESVVAAVIDFITGSLLEKPRRVGRELRNELAGIHSARRRSYRVLYRIDESERTVDRIGRVKCARSVEDERRCRDPGCVLALGCLFGHAELPWEQRSRVVGSAQAVERRDLTSSHGICSNGTSVSMRANAVLRVS